MGLLRNSLYLVLIAVLYQQGKKFTSKKWPLNSGGFAAPGWQKVADVFNKHLEQGSELGGIFTVYHRGESVVEVWGGYADEDAKIPWDRNKLSVYCSTTKAIAAIVLQMLAERGHIDYDAPVARYWPDFAQQGKEKVTVEQLVSHQAGLAFVDRPFSFYDILNQPDVVGEALAAQTPSWTPGEAFGYHAFTMGLLVDQLVRRVDPKRRSLSTFFQEEVAGPFGIDFYIGLPKVQNHRTARVVPADILKWDTIAATRYWNLNYAMIFDSGSLISKTLQNPAELAEMNALLNNPLFREVPIASLNGFGTGSSMAKLMGILGNGGHVKGQRLLKPESIRHLGTVIMNGTDMVLMSEVAFGPGTLIHKATHQDNIFGHAGLGGQIAYADPALKLGWSYLTNHFSIYGFGDAPTTMELQRAMYDCAFKLQENES